MGVIAAIGFELILGAAIGLIVTVIGLFFGHIILFDSIALAIVSGFVSHGILHTHPALSIMIGIAIFCGLLWLQNTRVGFWLIGGMLSLAWGLVFSSMAYEFTSKDMFWTYVVLGIGVLVMLGLHLKARNSVHA